MPSVTAFPFLLPYRSATAPRSPTIPALPRAEERHRADRLTTMITYTRNWLNAYSHWHVEISSTNGRFTDRIFTPFAKTADAAVAQTLRELRHRIPTSGTMVVYHYPVIELWPTDPPNSLTAVYDYTPKELYIVPLPLHFKRIASRWQQLTLQI